MPADTTYGVQLAVELGIGRASDAARWGQSPWGLSSRWGHTDTTLGDWVDVTCDVLDGVRLTAGSNTDDGVTRRWESASASFTLDGEQWDPWNGPHADVIGDRVPARVRWRYPPDPAPVVLRTNLASNPSVEVNTTRFGVYFSPTAARVNTWSSSGAWSYQVTKTAASNQGVTYIEPRADIVQGNAITVGVDLVSPTGGTFTIAGRVAKSGSPGFAEGMSGKAVVLAAGVPQRATISYTVPAPNAAGTITGVGFQVYSGAAGPVGQVLRVDAVTVELGTTDGSWFSGATPDTPDRDYAWTGPAEQSTSTVSTVQHHDGTWTPAFTGFIATRGYAWNPDEQQAGVACVDGTSVLVASDRVASPPAGAGETASARVTRIVTAALWAGALDVTAGGTTVQATTLDTPAWDELLQVADTDLALLWITRAGALAYRPRGRVGVGVVLAGRLVVCPAGPDDVQVMTLGRNQPSVTRNRVEVARRKDETVPGDVPVVARIEDRQSIARFQAHDFKRTDLWHTDDTWSVVVAQAVMGAGAWPSPAPGQLALDTVTADPRVPVLLLTVEPSMAFDVVDDGGRTYRQAVIGWDMALSHDGIEAVLHVEDVTRWSNVGHWGTAHWGVDRWGIGGI